MSEVYVSIYMRGLCCVGKYMYFAFRAIYREIHFSTSSSSAGLYIYIYIYTYTHTHTHTHIVVIIIIIIIMMYNLYVSLYNIYKM